MYRKTFYHSIALLVIKKDFLNKKFLSLKQYEQITLQQQEKKEKSKKSEHLQMTTSILERIKMMLDDAANPIEKLLSILNSYG